MQQVASLSIVFFNGPQCKSAYLAAAAAAAVIGFGFDCKC